MSPKSFICYTVILIMLLLVNSCVNVNLITGVVHHASCANPETGAIDQTINILNLNDYNVSHQWSNGASTQNISGIAPIYPDNYRYKITLSPISGSGTPISFTEKYDVLFKTDWVTLDHMMFDENAERLFNQTAYSANTSSGNIIPEDALGYFEFTVGRNTAYANNYDCGKIGFNSIDQLNAGTVNNFNGFLFLDWISYFIVIRNGVWVAAQYYAPNDRFQIRYESNAIRFYKNGNQFYSDLASGSHPESYIQASIAGNSFFIEKVNSTFGCSKIADYYANLGKDVDGSCYTMTNSIKVKYNEKYNDNILNYTIYNWKRVPVLQYPGNGSATITANQTGFNYHLIPVNNKLSSEMIYYFEATNAKNEVYKMRFIYNNYINGFVQPNPQADAVTIGNDYD